MHWDHGFQEREKGATKKTFSWHKTKKSIWMASLSLRHCAVMRIWPLHSVRKLYSTKRGHFSFHSPNILDPYKFIHTLFLNTFHLLVDHSFLRPIRPKPFAKNFPTNIDYARIWCYFGALLHVDIKQFSISNSLYALCTYMCLFVCLKMNQLFLRSNTIDIIILLCLYTLESTITSFNKSNPNTKIRPMHWTRRTNNPQIIIYYLSSTCAILLIDKRTHTHIL